MSYSIYNEDCLAGMSRLDAGSVDAIITDPPYCVGVSSNGTKTAFSDFNLIRPFWEQVFSLWRRVLKAGGHVYCCTDWRTYPFLYPIMIRYFDVRNLIVWDFNWIKTGNQYRHRYELIIFATAGKSARQIPRSEPDVWNMACVNYTQKRLHPAQKPVALMERMIRNSTVEGDTVLDSFMGSGTTGVACLNLGRNFIGFELDAGFYETAQKRIDAAVAEHEQSLFSMVT